VTFFFILSIFDPGLSSGLSLTEAGLSWYCPSLVASGPLSLSQVALFSDYWLAPGELPVEAQFTEFQQGAHGASLVTINRPRWCANIVIETEYMGS
jgi:hypothetical protein